MEWEILGYVKNRIKRQHGSTFSRDVNQLFLHHLLKWRSSWLMTFKMERRHSLLILMNHGKNRILQIWRCDPMGPDPICDSRWSYLEPPGGGDKDEDIYEEGPKHNVRFEEYIVHKRRNIMFKNNWIWNSYNKKLALALTTTIFL